MFNFSLLVFCDFGKIWINYWFRGNIFYGGVNFNLYYYIKNFLDKLSIEVMIYGKNEFF